MRTNFRAALISLVIVIALAGPANSSNNQDNATVDYIHIDEARLSELIKQLSDDDERVRASTADALGQIGPYAMSAVPSLLKALEDESLQVRAAAYYALACIEPSDYQEVGIRELINLLRVGDDPARAVAAWSLYKLGAIAKAGVPALLDTVSQCQNGDVCQYSIMALGEMGSYGKLAIPQLRALARREPGIISNSAAKSVQKIEEALRETRE